MSGRESSFQLTRLAAKYNEMQANGNILSNRNAREIIWARVQQLAERIDMNEAPERMAKIQALWKDFRDKEARGKAIEATLVEKEIDDELEAAHYDFLAWKQMFEALELHSKMTESEAKIAKDLHAIMTVEDGMEMMAKVMAVLLRVLQDNPKKLKEVQYELTRVIDANLSTRSGVGSGETGIHSGPGVLDRTGVYYPGDEERPEVEGADEAGGLSERHDTGSSE